MMAHSLANAHIAVRKEWEYRKRTPATMSNREIKKEICNDVEGGCAECEMLENCQYGKEYIGRGLQ